MWTAPRHVGVLLVEGILLDGAADHCVTEALYLRDPDANGAELRSHQAGEGGGRLPPQT